VAALPTSSDSLSRAVAVGGLAGILGGWAFGQWMAKVNHFPLIAGLIHLSSPNAGIALHFVFAFIIGATFGLLFQRDVRGYGSCLGWGFGYGIFWWFLGPMTLMPLWQGRNLDWSYLHGQELYGSLVGHVVYGLIVGVIYATADRLWIALFIESDPINRQPEPPGSRTVRSIGWGAVAGLVGGLVFFADHYRCHRPVASSRICRWYIAGSRCDCSSVHQRTDWCQLWTPI
jgi:hypothetical protein